MKIRRYFRTIAAVTLALALTGLAGQAETDDQRVWMNAADGQSATAETQEAAIPPMESTIPQKPCLPAKTKIPVRQEVYELQQEATEPTVPLTAEKEPPKEETTPLETVPIETVPQPTAPPPAPAEPPESVPEETVPPETVPEETVPPEPEPEPPASGDIYSASEAMTVGNSYAASAYGMMHTPELGFGNASYEFADAAYVSGLKVLGGQAFLNQMVIAKVDSLVENLYGAYGGDTDISAYRVNCYVEYDPDGEVYWIYVFYG